jgi:hypothetical protein
MDPVSLLPCSKSVHQFLCSYTNLVNLNSCLVQILGVLHCLPVYMIRVQYHTVHNTTNTRILKVPCAKHARCIRVTFILLLYTDWNRLDSLTYVEGGSNVLVAPYEIRLIQCHTSCTSTGD